MGYKQVMGEWIWNEGINGFQSTCFLVIYILQLNVVERNLKFSLQVKL